MFLARIVSALFLACALILSEALADTQPAIQKLQVAREKANAEAEKYQAEARKRDLGPMGNLYAGWESDKQSCIALAIALGKEASTKAIKTEAPPLLSEVMDWEEEEKIQHYAESQSSLVHAADHFLSLSESQRGEVWNLECVGRYNIPTTDYVLVEASELTFRVSDDGTALTVLGSIESGFAEKFSRVIAENSSIESVHLGSGGGGLIEAVEAGYMIRALGLKTRLYSGCYSACALLFMAGVERYINFPSPPLGFHQVSVSGNAVSPANSVYGAIASYSEYMGSNSKFVLAAMFSAAPEDMSQFDWWTLCENGVVTFIRTVGHCKRTK